MITFAISVVVLILGYFIYGRFVERVFGPDDRPTAAVSKADGLDYVVMPNWKIFMIQFLNIAGTGPIFGAIMGAKFGPVAYLWIVLGCIFAGATHDYLSGMLSMRNEGHDLPTLIRKYLGNTTAKIMLVFTILLLVMVGAVFVYSPAEILHRIGGPTVMWMVIIFIYYLIATLLPIDKIIGKIYPVFAFALLFMAVALFTVLIVKQPDIPELWEGFRNLGKESGTSFTDSIFPCLFITIACGAISGFHATQSPLMARCLKSERSGRPIFYGAMITEGLVALVWATVAMWFFYGSPAPGYELIAGAHATGYNTSAPSVVDLVCRNWLGVAGSILALLGVVAAPITSGDTALRSARLIVAQMVNLDQRPIRNRFIICIPIFAASFLLLLWQINNPNGFNFIWQYFGWANQTLSVFTLWMLTVYLATNRKPYIITLIPALFMTTVCATFIFVSPQAMHLPAVVGYPLGIVCCLVAAVWFGIWMKNKRNKVLQ